MKKWVVIFLLFITACSYGQEKLHLYQLKIDQRESLVSKLQIDSTIAVLIKRLLNTGYNNSIVAYNNSERAFTVETESSIGEEFIRNWLIKPCEVSFYETYNTPELLEILLAYPRHDIDLDQKKAFYKLLNISDSSVNDRRITNVGSMKLSDTTEFNMLSKNLKSFLPEDCLFACKRNLTLSGNPVLAVFALRNNASKLVINEILDQIKVTVDNRGEPSLSIRFNTIGAKKFERMTTKNVNKGIAIMIDGSLYSVPLVLGPIEGGNIQISGDFKANEAKSLVNMLAGGYLPIRLSLIKQVTD